MSKLFKVLLYLVRTTLGPFEVKGNTFIVNKEYDLKTLERKIGLILTSLRRVCKNVEIFPITVLGPYATVRVFCDDEFAVISVPVVSVPYNKRRL